jgi:3-phosphoshikimate 1-carboxyvinyltransferase
MQNLSVKAGRLPPSVQIPPSKSYANRALILASINKEEIVLKNMPQASDVTLLVTALQQIGLEIIQVQNQISVLNHFPACEKKSDLTIEVGEGGTTARFLASLLILGNRKYTLVLGERLKLRPWKEFLKLAADLGVFASLEDHLLVVQGPIKKIESIEVDCSETTQFASGLQLALAYSQPTVAPMNLSASQSYFEMTQFMIGELGKNQEFVVPMDWSSASFPMCFAALSHEIFFPGLKYDPLQSDAKLFHILKDLGCLKEDQRGITVFPGATQMSLNLDVSDCLDLVPALGFLLSHIDGIHTLTGVKNLEHKESHRLEEIVKLIKEFGKEAVGDGSKLIITGNTLGRVSAKIKEEEFIPLKQLQNPILIFLIFLNINKKLLYVQGHRHNRLTVQT